MKKNSMVCLMVVLVMLLCACGGKEAAEVTHPTEGKYQMLIDKLEAGEYDAARAMIDAMEGNSPKEPPVETAPVQTEPPSVQAQPQAVQNQEGTVIELTKENAKDYFEATVNFFNGDEKSFHQAIALKEEYRFREIRLEDVTLEVSYLMCNAYGSVNNQNGEFYADSFEILSSEKQTVKVPIDNSKTGYLSNGTYVKGKGYFPNYVIEPEIVSGSGRLILMDE